MNYIIFDLEARYTFHPKQKKHILEVGAVKVAEVDNKLIIVDEFREYVKPPKHKHILKKKK